MTTVQNHPKQQTAFVVRAGESKSARAVYRGDSPTEAHHVAKATTGATVTFRSAADACAFLLLA